MSNPILHIKDCYFFEVPKFLCPANYKLRAEFPDVWVQLDDQYQDWEFERLYRPLKTTFATSPVPPKAELHESWKHWQHDGEANFAKPFHRFLEQVDEANWTNFQSWKKAEIAKAGTNAADAREAKKLTFGDYAATRTDAQGEFLWLTTALREKSGYKDRWNEEVAKARDVTAYKQAADVAEWNPTKISNYNYHLSGKVLIPQVLGGKLRNLHEPESGIALSKFMAIEFAVALVLIVVLGWVGSKYAVDKRPKGKIWNLFESFYVFIRDEIAEPAIGHHDAHAFTPLLATLFFFILGCNLAGMIPWSSSPTGSWSVTLAMAFLTFGAVVLSGMAKMGPAGFFANLVPQMDLPPVLAVILKPAIFLLEFGGLLIKHAVLSVRLLANMLAGHLVLLAIMGMAFGAQAAVQFAPDNSAAPFWYLAAPLSIVGSALLSMLELFVAFLQAYVFTLLSALFIGASIHHH